VCGWHSTGHHRSTRGRSLVLGSFSLSLSRPCFRGRPNSLRCLLARLLARKRRTDFRTRLWPLCRCAPLSSRGCFVGNKLSDFFCNLTGRKATKIPCCFKKSLFHSTFLSIACVGRMWLLYFRVVAFLFAFCYGERVRF